MTDQPTTQAGRTYLTAHRADEHSPGNQDGPCWCRDSILAIEAEARAEQAATVEALRDHLNVALNQWRAYADEHPDRFNGTWGYLDEPARPGDEEAAMFDEARALLADTAKASEEWLVRHDAEVIRAAFEADREHTEADIRAAVVKRVDEISGNAKRAERQRLLSLFDLGWRAETSDSYPDGETAAIGYAIRRVRDRLIGHREDDPECDCESCRSIAQESEA